VITVATDGCSHQTTQRNNLWSIYNMYVSHPTAARLCFTPLSLGSTLTILFLFFRLTIRDRSFLPLVSITSTSTWCRKAYSRFFYSTF
jgi:hypothetical protein